MVFGLDFDESRSPTQVTQDMLSLHDRLMAHEEAGPLLEPVDPIALQIPV
jgi:hypothetical protein